MNPRTLAALLLLCGASCRSSELQAPANDYPPLEAASFGTMHNVSVSGSIWTGATPEEQDLELAQRRGVTTVIDLSSPAEESRPGAQAIDAAAICERLELDYVHPDGLDAGRPEDATVELVLATLSMHEDEPLLMYCGTGRRCAAFLAIHRAADLDVPLDEAIAEARRAGMRPEDEAFVQAQVERLRPEAGTLRE